MASSARAEDKLSYSIVMMAASDYIFRGISFNDETPTLQPSIELNYNIFYAGIWGSHIDFADIYGPWEVDYYIGMRPTTGPINWDLAVLYYTYGSRDSSLSTSDLSYFELKAAASTSPVSNLTVGVTGYYTPDQDVAIVETKTIEGNASYVLPEVGIFAPTVSGLVGWAQAEADGFWLGEKDYTYWNAGLRVDVEKFFMDFRYWDTTIDHGLADERFVFSAGVNLLP